MTRDGAITSSLAFLASSRGAYSEAAAIGAARCRKYQVVFSAAG